jgi:hypothetical protein
MICLNGGLQVAKHADCEHQLLHWARGSYVRRARSRRSRSYILFSFPVALRIERRGGSGSKYGRGNVEFPTRNATCTWTHLPAPYVRASSTMHERSRSHPRLTWQQQRRAHDDRGGGWGEGRLVGIISLEPSATLQRACGRRKQEPTDMVVSHWVRTKSHKVTTAHGAPFQCRTWLKGKGRAVVGPAVRGSSAARCTQHSSTRRQIVKF